MLRSNHNSLEIATYGIPDAAKYLHVHTNTLRYWTTGTRSSPPVINIADPETPLLSFMDLVECWVLAGLRHRHRLPMQSIRRAVETLRDHHGSEHPLAERDFQTDGVDLFIEIASQPVNLSRRDQYGLREIVQAYLRRIDRDVEGIANRLYPFTRKAQLGVGTELPRVVVIDPTVSFGRPVLYGTGISTAFLNARVRGGDRPEALAREYGCGLSDIEEAIRFEKGKQAA